MKERPILMSAPMVLACLREVDPKTQTRRVFKGLDGAPVTGQIPAGFATDPAVLRKCPYGAPGDRLWVREAWTKVPASAYRVSEGVQQTVNPTDAHEAAIYAAGWDRSIPKWRPSIHMPRWASRLTLQISDVRVERLQDISDADAIAEGIERDKDEPTFWRSYTSPNCLAPHPVHSYATLWERINGPGSWDANPWVWVVAFERLK